MIETTIDNNPLVSVLICTYNRSAVLQRAMSSVLTQTWVDLELIIIDDCSTDDTQAVVSAFSDPRIRYVRNKTNIGSSQGDRAHVRRFVYELMKGSYFVYLCDDDYWPNPRLLEQQVQAFQTYDNLAMVVGGQLSYFIDSDQVVTPLNIDIVAIPQISYKDLHNVPLPPTLFLKELYNQSYMTSEAFLTAFSSDPVNRNIVAGATLYSKKHFIAAGAMSSEYGSKWQAGYEFSLGPACMGDVVYFDEPSVIVEVRPNNASFRGTQLDHYLDCIVSINTAFKTPLEKTTILSKRRLLKSVKRETIRKVTQAFLSNTLTIKMSGKLTACGEENIHRAVQPRHAFYQFLRHAIFPKLKDIKYFCALQLPTMMIKKMLKSVII